MNKLKLRIMQLYTVLLYSLVKIFGFVFKNKYNNVWLIAERGDEARDNGYAFFEYMIKNHPEEDVRYVITKNSPDINKINLDRIVYYKSIKHCMMYINAKYLISSHIMGFSPEFRSFGKLEKKFSFFKGKGKKIFLQHGITKDYIEDLTSKRISLDLFICGAKPEYDYIVKNFGYNSKVVRYTGFPRFDNLKNENSNFILFMPTWRKDLFYCKNEEEFKKTEYFIQINKILLDKELNEQLASSNMKLIFYPHYEIQKFIHSFKASANVIIASKNVYTVPTLLKQCKMLITDYSSVFFDVAYLKKPILYYQYDYEQYRMTQYSEGYFDYKRDGFGPIVKQKSLLIKYIIKYIENNFSVEKNYIDKRNNFFVYSDTKNSERIYEIIKKL